MSQPRTDPAGGSLEIRLLGEVRVERNGGRLPGFDSLRTETTSRRRLDFNMISRSVNWSGGASAVGARTRAVRTAGVEPVVLP